MLSIDLVKRVCGLPVPHITSLFFLLKPGGNFWFGIVFSYGLRDGGSFRACGGTTSIRMNGNWREGGFGLLSGTLTINNCCVFNLHSNFW